MIQEHPYFTHPELFYQTKLTKIKYPSFDLMIEEIEDLDRCIDFQCSIIEKSDFSDFQNRIMEDLCPYFAKIWNCALNLTHWCISHQEVFKHKNILEIGAGLALPSLVLKKLGNQVTATDFHPHSQFFMHKNQHHNNLHFPYHIKSWKELCEIDGFKFDMIIASDVLYEGKYIGDLLQLLLKLLKPEGQVILADPVRGYLQKFINDASTNFNHELETFNCHQHENFILKLRRRI
jgi:predicted nicotinamide N-methyase